MYLSKNETQLTHDLLRSNLLSSATNEKEVLCMRSSALLRRLGRAGVGLHAKKWVPNLRIMGHSRSPVARMRPDFAAVNQKAHFFTDVIACCADTVSDLASVEPSIAELSTISDLASAKSFVSDRVSKLLAEDMIAKINLGVSTLLALASFVNLYIAQRAQAQAQRVHTEFVPKIQATQLTAAYLSTLRSELNTAEMCVLRALHNMQREKAPITKNSLSKHLDGLYLAKRSLKFILVSLELAILNNELLADNNGGKEEVGYLYREKITKAIEVIKNDGEALIGHIDMILACCDILVGDYKVAKKVLDTEIGQFDDAKAMEDHIKKYKAGIPVTDRIVSCSKKDYRVVMVAICKQHEKWLFPSKTDATSSSPTESETDAISTSQTGLR